MTYPRVPAAFINAIAEEGTKDEAVTWLQKQWDETCALRKAGQALIDDVRRRYPGEELKCPYMRALDAALTNSVS